MPAVRLVRALRLHTADHAVISRIRQGYTAVAEGGYNCLIIIHGRHAGSQAYHLTCSVQKLLRSILVNTDREGGLRKLHMGCRHHTHVGDIVSCVQSIAGLTADNQVLESAVTGKCLCGYFISDFAESVEFYP